MSKALKVLKPFKLGLRRFNAGETFNVETPAEERLIAQGFIGTDADLKKVETAAAEPETKPAENLTDGQAKPEVEEPHRKAKSKGKGKGN